MKEQKIIIKKVKGKGHKGGHHGGEWKVAYADFITAMMAFFLLMWLIAILAPEKKKTMAQYFKDVSIFENTGSGFFEKKIGIMGDAGAPKTKSQHGDFAQLGREEFLNQLKKDIETNLREVKDQVLLEVYEGGVRIQIVDKEGHPMFALGSPELTPEAKNIIKVITKSIISQGNNVAIEGHTDALNYSTTRYTNWELSTQRASAARKELETEGLNPDRLIRVAGYASKEPLIKDNPNDPRNRRISIILLYNSSKGSPNPLPGMGLPSEIIGSHQKPPSSNLAKTSPDWRRHSPL
ncbi:MAG: OmpA family protein [Deltaproteobacteria bacterium]|nr:OmpA family protein [Deltaproteobacteria bacterium]